MKNSIILCATILLSIFATAQNQNVTDVTKTVTTTIKDSSGERKIVKKQETKEIQNIELESAKPDTKNVEVKETPTQVTTLTKITDESGNTTFADKDYSGKFVLNNSNFLVTLDAKGYLLTNEAKKMINLRKTGTSVFVLNTKEYQGICYFDVDGNLLIEKYYLNSNTVVIDKYLVQK